MGTKKKTVIALTALLFLAPAWAGEKESKKKSEIWLSNPDQYVFDKIEFQESFFMPKTDLVAGPQTVYGWFDRLTHHFSYEQGNNVLLHFEGKHYSKKSGGVLPNYAVQLNIEIPRGRFKSWERIEAKDLKGYLSWIHPDFPKGDLYIPIAGGYVQIQKVKEGKLYGHLDLKFGHEKLKEPIHIYGGRIRAGRLTRQQYASLQEGMTESLYKEAEGLEEMPVPKDLLKPARKRSRRGGPKKEEEARGSTAW
ncbi:MAG: hypothetical protein HY609_04610 [Deltaproteobacteria bacterium]|nr:hypothetical protein [Deltaproteobacteria bacterium]MBI4224192.1 hypothetical protein [Deltaproteobacteria bacterium]